MTLVFADASLIAVYGLVQTWDGMPTSDDEVNQVRLRRPSVGRSPAPSARSRARPIASFLGIAIVTAVTFALDRRPYLLPAVPLLAVALFFESGRAIVVTTAVAVVVLRREQEHATRHRHPDRAAHGRAGARPCSRRAAERVLRVNIARLPPGRRPSAPEPETVDAACSPRPARERPQARRPRPNRLWDRIDDARRKRLGGTRRRQQRSRPLERVRRHRNLRRSRLPGDPRPRADRCVEERSRRARRGLALDPRHARSDLRPVAERQLLAVASIVWFSMGS